MGGGEERGDLLAIYDDDCDDKLAAAEMEKWGEEEGKCKCPRRPNFTSCPQMRGGWFLWNWVGWGWLGWDMHIHLSSMESEFKNHRTLIHLFSVFSLSLSLRVCA